VNKDELLSLIHEHLIENPDWSKSVVDLASNLKPTGSYQTIKLDVKQGRKEIRAYCDRGLAVHKDAQYGIYYVITHIASGQLLANDFRTLNSAKKAMYKFLETGIDFTVSGDELSENKDKILEVKGAFK